MGDNLNHSAVFNQWRATMARTFALACHWRPCFAATDRYGAIAFGGFFCARTGPRPANDNGRPLHA